jgi:hypothetical protein
MPKLIQDRSLANGQDASAAFGRKIVEELKCNFME